MADTYNRQFGGSVQDWVSRRELSSAKPSRYHARGCARDGYIEQDNGGLYKRYQAASAMSVGNLRTANGTPEFNLCDLLSKRVGYVTNGSGRDSYINQSNGGFYPPKEAAEFTKVYFTNKLREYPRPSTPSHYVRPSSTKKARRMSKVNADQYIGSVAADPYLCSQVYFQKNKGITEANRTLLMAQKFEQDRLSKPKRQRPTFLDKTQTKGIAELRRSTVVPPKSGPLIV